MEFAGLLPKQRFAVVGAAKAGHCELGKVSMTPLLEARLGRGCEVGGGTSGIPTYRSAGFCAICNGGSKMFASASHGISGTSGGSATESHSRPLEGFLPYPCDDPPQLRHPPHWFRPPSFLRIGNT